LNPVIGRGDLHQKLISKTLALVLSVKRAFSRSWATRGSAAVRLAPCSARLKQEPVAKKRIYDQLKKYGSKMANEPSLRFILTRETDANDVDFHIRDEKGGHAFYSSPVLIRYS